MNSIIFFVEEIDFKIKSKKILKNWIVTTIHEEEFKIKNLNIIFCSDEYLHTINVKYLNHDTYTDIITFDNSEENNIVEGDIFISIDRVKDNATNLNNPFLQELKRVIIHGILHLLGYSDKSPSKKIEMTTKENFYLKKLEEDVPRGTVGRIK